MVRFRRDHGLEHTPPIMSDHFNTLNKRKVDRVPLPGKIGQVCNTPPSHTADLSGGSLRVCIWQRARAARPPCLVCAAAAPWQPHPPGCAVHVVCLSRRSHQQKQCVQSHAASLPFVLHYTRVCLAECPHPLRPLLSTTVSLTPRPPTPFSSPRKLRLPRQCTKRDSVHFLAG